jgi:Xaa-Pro aminopeptidase
MVSIERGKFAEFPKSEYDARLQKIQKLMRERSLDALFVSSKDNLIYFSGYKSWLLPEPDRPFVVLIHAEKDPVLLLPVIERGDGEALSFIEDIRVWGTYWGAPFTDPIDLYADTIRDLGLSKGVIAAELGQSTRLGLPLLDWQRLTGRIPEAKFVDGSDILWESRRVKSPLEIQRIAKACEITDKSIEATWKVLKVGMTERDLAKVVVTTMMEEGADGPAFIIVRSGLPYGRLMMNKYATDLKIGKGDMVDLDLGAYYRDYQSDMIRTACLGKPTADQAKFHKIAQRCNEECRKAVRPGVKISEINDVRERVQKEEQVLEYAFRGVGHGIGLTGHEEPSIGPGNNTPLEPGMVFTVEPGFSVEQGSFFVEDVLVVTKSGYDLLTHADREMFIA